MLFHIHNRSKNGLECGQVGCKCKIIKEDIFAANIDNTIGGLQRIERKAESSCLIKSLN